MKKPSAATQKPAGTPPAAPSPRRLCVFKVALREDRRTWRRIAIRQNQTLEDLHDAIFAAFDRHDPHLFSFYLLLPADDKRRRGQRRPPEGTPEYVHPFTLEDLPFWMEDAPVHDATATRLADLRLQPGQRLEYLFDYGDEWWHELTVEAVDAPTEKGKRYPLVMERRGDSPPQYSEPDEQTGESNSVWVPGGIGDQIAALLGLGPLPEGPVKPLPKSKPRRAPRQLPPPGE